MRSLVRQYPDGFETRPTSTGSHGGAVLANVVIPFPLPWAPAAPDVVMPVTIDRSGVISDVTGRVVGSSTLGINAMSFLRTSPKIQFKKVKVGNTWQVRWRETIVAVSDPGKTPNALVKRLNNMIRGIGTNNTVYQANLFDALLELFQQASADVRLCRPTMRVDF